jgi:hypothetical protein
MFTTNGKAASERGTGRPVSVMGEEALIVPATQIVLTTMHPASFTAMLSKLDGFDSQVLSLDSRNQGLDPRN